MERRRVQRIKRRLPCQFLHEGNRYRGIVVDLSPGGLFMQTDTALDPGAELEIRLSGNRFPELTLRAVVARRRFTPAVLASMIRRGVGLRILEAPPEYYEALQRGGNEPSPPDAEAADEGLTIEIEVSQPELPPQEASRQTPAEPCRPVPDSAPEEPAVVEAAPEEEVELPTQGDDSGAEASEGWIFEPGPGVQALVIDDGELDDVYGLLLELGASPVRRSGSEAAGFRGWSVPPRLLVVSARHAPRLRVPSHAVEDGVVAVAVAEADSQTLRALLRREGFQYVVRRPVHPEALRLLLMRGLHRETERRAATRLAFGYEVSWRAGWGRRPGMMIDLSAGGCRVLSREAPEPGTRLTLRIPREVAGGRALSLTGRVLRCERRLGSIPEARHAFAVRFEGLSSRSLERLGSILQERQLGPATLPGRRRQEERPTRRRPTRLRLRPTPPATAAPEEPRPERRRSGRAAIVQEVVALGPGAQRVQHILFGRDLSLGGMRVEPHPELALGDRIRLAIYHATLPDALVLEATVERDDGARGLALRFDEPGEEARDRLERMISELPTVDCQLPGRPAKSLVVSEIVSG